MFLSEAPFFFDGASPVFTRVGAVVPRFIRSGGFLLVHIRAQRIDVRMSEHLDHRSLHPHLLVQSAEGCLLQWPLGNGVDVWGMKVAERWWSTLVDGTRWLQRHA